MSDVRRSPLVAQIVLLVAFVAIAVAGVFTVLVPELSDADDEPSEAAGEASEADPDETDPDEADPDETDPDETDPE